MTLTQTTIVNADDNLVAALIGIVGEGEVSTGLAERTFYSTDISGRGEVAEAVVHVDSAETLSAVVRACTSRGRIVIPRGGGFSYTGGYTPTSPNCVIVDMRPMNRIVEINEEDMYVDVETGCTWERLYEALKAKGLRTPYFGPMSGYSATVGGALSQGSLFLGSTQYGTVADSTLGLEIVLANGEIVRTGSSASTIGTSPFFRQYGPDATGLFLNDTGAMGLKTKAFLRLIPFPAHQAYGTFALTGHAQVTAAVSAVGRSGLAAECYCWDPYFVKLMKNASTGVKQDLQFLLNVVKAGSNIIDGLGAALRIAMAGRSVFSGDTFLMHVVIDDASAAGAAAKLKIIRDMALRAGAKEVSPSAPRALRGTPFTNFNVPERRIARRNLPVHGLAPHSKAPAVAADIYRLLEDRREEMERLGVSCGVIFFAVGQQAMCIEPLLYWDDNEQLLHNRIEQTSDLEALSHYADRPPATHYAMRLRQELKDLFVRHGCIHMQIARSYPWAQTRQPATLALITAMKDAVDPKRLINRGSLGFGGPNG